MKATKNINIYLIDKKPIKVIDVVQYDTGIQLVFTVKDFPIPSDATATLYVEKPSGKFVYQKDNITVSGNTITVDLENQALTEHGRIPYQVTVTSGSDTFTTFTGLMMVERSLKDAGAVESRTVIRAFDEVTIDEIAEFQANARTIADAVIATIPGNYTELTAKVNESANAIKGHLSGAVVSADDVSPVEHLMNVKAKSKNLFNYDAFKTVGANNGNVTFGDDGIITLKATSNDCYTQHSAVPEGARIPAKKGDVFTLSWETDADTTGKGLVLILPEGKAIDFKTADATGKKLTYTVTKDYKYIVFRVGVSTAGDTIKYWNLQLEEGNMATEYTPYVDPSTVKVRRCGKNLTVNNIHDMEWGGITITKNDDGSFYATGTATQNLYFQLNNDLFLREGKYKLTGCPDGGGSDTFILYMTNDDFYAQDAGNGMTFNFASNAVVPLRLAIYNGAVLNKVLFRPMIHLASITDDTYEKYEGLDYIPTSDGVVSGVASISPNMTILTDTEGVIVECEYNKDTNKVVKKITDALGITI